MNDNSIPFINFKCLAQAQRSPEFHTSPGLSKRPALFDIASLSRASCGLGQLGIFIQNRYFTFATDHLAFYC